MQLEVPKTVTIDDVEHPVSGFSEGVQRLVEIHTQWRSDLAGERLALAKTEAAIRNLDTELTQMIMTELKEREIASEEVVQQAPVAE